MKVGGRIKNFFMSFTIFGVRKNRQNHILWIGAECPFFSQKPGKKTIAFLLFYYYNDIYIGLPPL